MRPRSWKGLEFYKKHMVKWKGTQEHHHITLGSAPLTRSVSCSVVCPYVWPAWSSDLGLGMPWSQSSCGVLTAWGCWESGGGQPALAWKKRAKKKKKKLHKLSAFVSRRWIFDLILCNIRQHRSACLQGGLVIMCVCVVFFVFYSKWKTKVSQGGEKTPKQNSALLCLPEEEA